MLLVLSIIQKDHYQLAHGLAQNPRLGLSLEILQDKIFMASILPVKGSHCIIRSFLFEIFPSLVLGISTRKFVPMS